LEAVLVERMFPTLVHESSGPSLQIQVPSVLTEGEVAGNTAHQVPACCQTFDWGFSPVFAEALMVPREVTVSWARLGLAELIIIAVKTRERVKKQLSCRNLPT